MFNNVCSTFAQYSKAYKWQHKMDELILWNYNEYKEHKKLSQISVYTAYNSTQFVNKLGRWGLQSLQSILDSASYI